MSSSHFRSIGIILSLIMLSGCASVLTKGAPPETHVVDGEKTVGDLARYDYTMIKSGNGFVVMKSPYCVEMVEKSRISRKRLRGVLFCAPETVFFGLGIADCVYADQISTASETVESVELAPTGEIVPCGRIQPAANASVIVQFPDQGMLKYLYTDEKGQLDTGAVTAEASGDAYLNFFLQNGPSVIYLTTLWLD